MRNADPPAFDDGIGAPTIGKFNPVILNGTGADCSIGATSPDTRRKSEIPLRVQSRAAFWTHLVRLRVQAARTRGQRSFSAD